MLRKAYYFLKPVLPWKVRFAARRFIANGLRRRFAASWPINPLAGRAPEGWSGWPHGKKFAFVLTHDVEGQKGVGRCRPLAELDLRLGFRSSFNFVPEGESEIPKSLRDFLTSSGFEVGVQDLRHDGKLYKSRHSFRADAQKINRYLADWGAVGFRSGMMMHNLDWLGDLNVQYDSSTFDSDPFEPQPDPVNTIFPFWVPRSDGSGYVELPYTLPQDSTLFLLFHEKTIDIWKQKLDWVAQQGGLALLNTHPDYMNFDETDEYPGYGLHLYQSFLEYAVQKYKNEAWFALPREVAAHVREQTHKFSASAAPAAIAGSAAEPAPRASASLPGDGSGVERLQLHGKRVGMVLFSFYPDDPRPRRAAEALVSRGMRVELICLRENADDPKHEVVNGVEVRRVPMTRRRGGALGYFFQYSAFILISFWILTTRLLTGRYDLVYVHNMPDILVFSGLIPKLFGAKVILDQHDPMPELMMTIYGFHEQAGGVRLLKLLEKWSLGFADAVVTVNRACAKMFAARSCPAQKIHVVMNSPDEGIFRFRPVPQPVSAPRADKPFVIMYHGSLVERNGLDLAVEAFARAKKSIPSAELTVYGSRNAFLERVMENVRKLGLQDSVHYMGPKPLEQIVKAIGKCDLGVIPNQRSIFTEINTPTRIFEYLALGKPVVAPRAPGICDYFDEQSLLYFELGNAEDLARQMQYAFEHPAEMAEIAKRGQAVHQTHTWREEKKRLTGLVSELLSDGARIRSSVGERPSSQPAPYKEGSSW